MKKLLLAICVWGLASVGMLFGESIVKESKSGDIKLTVNVGENIEFSIEHKGEKLLENARISMVTDMGAFGIDSKLLGVKDSENSATIKTVYGTKSEIKDEYKQSDFQFEKFDLQFRIYDDAVAYRFVSKGGENKGMLVFDENVELKFNPEFKSYVHGIDGFRDSYESEFKRRRVKELRFEKMISLPLVVEAKSAKMALLESDVYSYPSLNYTYKDGLHSSFAKYPTSFVKEGDVAYVVKDRADYIAKTKASRSFPWRIFLVAKEDAVLADNDIVYKLASPLKLTDTSWIKFGSASWEWWNNWNLENVNFESGMNMDTYEYYIDFAAKVKAPFLVIDAGWLKGGSESYDKMATGETLIDIPELVKYAKAKGVDIILWGTSRAMADDYISFLDRAKAFGVAGLKIDFMDRDDQVSMEFFENVAKAAAERKLTMDYHGCPKPVGMHRAYPNIVNYEGVRGNEWNKWSNFLTPRHKIDLVFTRMLCGPMDFTPGAMRRQLPAPEKSREAFMVSNATPHAMGTLANEMALYVLYYAPIQMLCDTPTEYEKKLDVAEFMAQTPTNWDETKVIEAKFGEYVAIARRKGSDWYVGAINNNAVKKMKIDLDFLGEGDYEATIFTDGQNSYKNPYDLSKQVKKVKSGDSLELKLAKFGGAALKIQKK